MQSEEDRVTDARNMHREFAETIDVCFQILYMLADRETDKRTEMLIYYRFPQPRVDL